VSDKTLELYAYNLSEFDLDDVRTVVRSFARRKRAEGETAFPALGDLTEPLQAMRSRRREEQRKAGERLVEIEEFWTWAGWWMEYTGNDKEELLKRFPGFKGTKPR
jgi:hypothetical protein